MDILSKNSLPLHQYAALADRALSKKRWYSVSIPLLSMIAIPFYLSMNYVTFIKLITVTLLSVKNHEKTASFPLIRENPREQLRLPPPDFPIHPENFFVYYVGSMKT
ncbi:hypothetical protein, partial [Mitsuokella jalaludinii]|uniref:hypothetical protein n=1 Tax=Mitsuokella jalaludinii TaxID=187979 RepID=UPI003AF95AC9